MVVWDSDEEPEICQYTDIELQDVPNTSAASISNGKAVPDSFHEKILSNLVNPTVKNQRQVILKEWKMECQIHLKI